MVQLNQVYIYKLWDVCTLLNIPNSGELAAPFVSREANRFKAGASLCPVLMDSEEFKLGEFCREDGCSRNPGFLLPSLALNLLWHLHSGESTVVYF